MNSNLNLFFCTVIRNTSRFLIMFQPYEFPARRMDSVQINLSWAAWWFARGCLPFRRLLRIRPGYWFPLLLIWLSDPGCRYQWVKLMIELFSAEKNRSVSCFLEIITNQSLLVKQKPFPNVFHNFVYVAFINRLFNRSDVHFINGLP